jgi:dolichyldiphosphatase
MFAGQLACEAANFILKRIIKEERPRRMNGKGYGMPSSHAQFVAYFAVSMTLFLLVRHRPSPHSPRRNQGALSLAERILWSAVGLCMATAVVWSRVYLNYHTTRQVLAGCAAGTVCAVGWFIVCAIARETGWLAWALDTPLATWFRFRDLLDEEDLCQAGWEKWDAKRTALRAKQKKESKLAQ